MSAGRPAPGLPPWLVTRAAAVLLWAMVAGSAGLALVAALTDAPPRRAEASPDPTGPSGFAELLVATWLRATQGDEATLAGLVAGEVDLDAATGTDADFDLAAVAARFLGRGRWTVVVSALERSAAPATPSEAAATAPLEAPDPATALRHYGVGVLARDGRHVATALPALVPAPTPLEAPPLALPAPGRPDPDDPVAASVQGFLGALLAGGDLDRYVAPGTAWRPVTPAPFLTVDLRRLAAATREDGSVDALADVVATDLQGRVQVLAYPLHLTSRDGRWEVDEPVGVPPLRRAP